MTYDITWWHMTHQCSAVWVRIVFIFFQILWTFDWAIQQCHMGFFYWDYFIGSIVNTGSYTLQHNTLLGSFIDLVVSLWGWTRAMRQTFLGINYVIDLLRCVFAQNDLISACFDAIYTAAFPLPTGQKTKNIQIKAGETISWSQILRVSLRITCSQNGGSDQIPFNRINKTWCRKPKLPPPSSLCLAFASRCFLFKFPCDPWPLKRSSGGPESFGTQPNPIIRGGWEPCKSHPTSHRHCSLNVL